MTQVLTGQNQVLQHNVCLQILLNKLWRYVEENLIRIYREVSRRAYISRFPCRGSTYARWTALQLCIYCCLMLIRTPDIFALRNARIRYSLHTVNIILSISDCTSNIPSYLSRSQYHDIGRFWIRNSDIISIIFRSYFYILNIKKYKFDEFQYLASIIARSLIISRCNVCSNFLYRSIAFRSQWQNIILYTIR